MTTSFEVRGAVDRLATYTLADLQALPAQTVAVTYQTGQGPVSASFTGPTLWSVLGTAGLTPVPGAKNSTLRNVVVATGSDGYEATFSLGELEPRFGGGGAGTTDLIAFAQDGQLLGGDGFARLVVPGDLAGGRYVSNLVSLQVLDAMAVPEPRTTTLLLLLAVGVTLPPWLARRRRAAGRGTP